MQASRVLTLVLWLSSVCLPEPAAYGQKSHDGGQKVTVTTANQSPQPSHSNISVGSTPSTTSRSVPLRTGISGDLRQGGPGGEEGD